jgi:hypothetical protein
MNCVFCGKPAVKRVTPWPKGGVVCEGCIPLAILWLKGDETKLTPIQGGSC